MQMHYKACLNPEHLPDVELNSTSETKLSFSGASLARHLKRALGWLVPAKVSAALTEQRIAKIQERSRMEENRSFATSN